jgi:hypothetical protein
MIKKIFLFSAMALVSSNSLAQNTAPATGQINAVIQRGITVDPVDALNFGTIFNGVDKTIDPALDLTNSASFDVAGASLAAISINLPSSVVISLGVGGTPQTDLTIDSFNHAGLTQLDPSGNGTFRVGARLTDNEVDQEAGTYSGSFIVNVTQTP